MKKRSIAIDGPSGAGKSTLARMSAEKFGFIYVDTGAIYRSVGLFTLKNGVSSGDEAGVCPLLDRMKIEMRHDASGVQRMYLNGEDISDEIRLPEVSIYASDVSAIPVVRARLMDMQREMAEKYDVIMDGRDIGTVVLPDATLKIFLTANPEDRARRRYEELTVKGIGTTYEDTLRDINLRDKNDSSRKTAPLRPAEDAVIIDTTGNSLEKSFEIVTSVIKEKLGL